LHDDEGQVVRHIAVNCDAHSRPDHLEPTQHTVRGPHAARESFSCGPRELSQLQKMLQKLDLE